MSILVENCIALFHVSWHSHHNYTHLFLIYIFCYLYLNLFFSGDGKGGGSNGRLSLKIPWPKAIWLLFQQYSSVIICLFVV